MKLGNPEIMGVLALNVRRSPAEYVALWLQDAVEACGFAVTLESP